MRIFTPRAFTDASTGTAAHISSIEAEEAREMARDLRVEANSAGICPKLAASLRQEAELCDRKAKALDKIKLGNHRMSKF